jgi:RNA polymerase sigma-70 factor (ECF subfamily)
MDPGQFDTKFLTRAARGDADALKSLLAETREQLSRHLAGRVPRDLRQCFDVDDIVQETHIKVFQRIDGLRNVHTRSFYRWVAAIALSRLRNAIRHHRAARRGGAAGTIGQLQGREDSAVALLDTMAGPGETPSRTVGRREIVAAVDRALAALPEHYRQALWLVHIEGLPVREVADRMGRSERGIHGLCRRGLKQMRDTLAPAGFFYSTSG